MSTHEREIVSRVDLCTGDGRLNPDARGWSRQPLHRANLTHFEGRNKRWDYWAILSGDLVVSSVVSDIDLFGLADVYWVDLTNGARGGRSIVADRSAGIVLPDSPGTTPLHVQHEQLDLAIVDDEAGTTLHATWTEDDGRPGVLDVTVSLPRDHESLNVVIAWDDETFR